MSQETVSPGADQRPHQSDEQPGSPGSYRPPPLYSGDAGSDPPGLRGGDGLKGEWWSSSDLLGAIGLSITSIAMVLFTGAFVDTLHDDSETGIVLGAIVAAFVSFALSLSITIVTRLPKSATITLLGLAALANVLIHVVSDGGESEIFGIPPGLIESAILSALPFAAAWLYVSRKHGRSLVDLGFIKTTGSSAYGMAIGAWLVAYVGLILWGLLIENVDSLAPPDNTSATLEIAGGSLVLAWLLAGLWGPAVEEIFFRGFLLGGLRNRVGPWPAVLVSSGIFAVFHIDPGLYVPTFLLGAAFGWVYLKTRSIWPSIFIHTAHNTLVLVLVWQDSN